MKPHKVIIRAPPFQMEQQLGCFLCCRPRPAHQGCHALANGQIDSLDKRRVEPPTQPKPDKGPAPLLRCAAAEHGRNAHQPSALITLLDLPIGQVCGYLPLAHPLPYARCPLSKMGRQRVEIEIQPIAREDGETVRGQPLLQGVHDRVGRGLRARTKVQHGDQFTDRVNRYPEPYYMRPASQSRAELIELEVGQMEAVRSGRAASRYAHLPASASS